jgi:hypothetical protein
MAGEERIPALAVLMAQAWQDDIANAVRWTRNLHAPCCPDCNEAMDEALCHSFERRGPFTNAVRDILLGEWSERSEESLYAAYRLSMESLVRALHGDSCHQIFDRRLSRKTIAQRLNDATCRHITAWAQNRGLDEQEVERLVLSVGSKAQAIAQEKGGEA